MFEYSVVKRFDLGDLINNQDSWEAKPILAEVKALLVGSSVFKDPMLLRGFFAKELWPSHHNREEIVEFRNPPEKAIDILWLLYSFTRVVLIWNELC